MEMDPEERADVLAVGSEQERGEEALVAVAVRLLEGVVVRLQSDGLPLVVYTDKELASGIGVEERGDRSHDDPFELLVRPRQPLVPADRGLELEHRTLALLEPLPQVRLRWVVEQRLLHSGGKLSRQIGSTLR